MTSITYSPTAQQAREVRRLWDVAANASAQHAAAYQARTWRLAGHVFAASFVLAWILL